MSESTNLMAGIEHLSAGVYAWHIQASWPTNPSDVAGEPPAQAMIGAPSTIDMRGQLTLKAAVPVSVVFETLWMAANASESIPTEATITKFALDPTGGGR